jgi:hypothetical protein
MKKPDLRQDCRPIVVYALSRQLARIIKRVNGAEWKPHASTGRRQATPCPSVCPGNRNFENDIIPARVSLLDVDM